MKNLIEDVENYCSNLKDGQCFKKNRFLLDLSEQYTSLCLKVRGRSQTEDSVLSEFKEQFVENFLIDFKTELYLAFNLSDNTSTLRNFDIFNNVHINKLTDDEMQSHLNDCLSDLVSHYGKEKTSNFQGIVTLSNPVIDSVANAI